MRYRVKYWIKNQRNKLKFFYIGSPRLAITSAAGAPQEGDETLIRLYQAKVFPYLMKKNIGKPEIISHRRRVLQNASGRILEIGIGTGLNLDLYPGTVTEITAIDAFVRVLPSSRVSVKLYHGTAEEMCFADNTFDTVVSTFSFCSVSDLHATLKEISRVLKPDGKLLFLEHGKAETRFAQRMQNAANPLFNVFACGCNVNRDYRQFLSEAGFAIEKHTLYRADIFPKWLVGYLHEGVATNAKGKAHIQHYYEQSQEEYPR